MKVLLVFDLKFLDTIKTANSTLRGIEPDFIITIDQWKQLILFAIIGNEIGKMCGW